MNESSGHRVVAGDALTQGLDHALELLRRTTALGRPVEGERVSGRHVEVVGLLVDLRQVEPRREHERLVHEGPTTLGKVGPREIQQGIEEEGDRVLVPVAIPPLGGVEDRVGEAGLRLARSDDPPGDPARRVGREGHDDVPDEVLLARRRIERLAPVEPGELVVDELGDANQVAEAGPRHDQVLRLEFEDLAGILERAGRTNPRYSRGSGRAGP